MDSYDDEKEQIIFNNIKKRSLDDDNRSCIICNHMIISPTTTTHNNNSNSINSEKIISDHYRQCLKALNNVVNRTFIQKENEEETIVVENNHYFQNNMIRNSMVEILKFQDDNRNVVNLMMTLPMTFMIECFETSERMRHLPRQYYRLVVDQDKDWDHLIKNKYNLIGPTCKELVINRDICADQCPTLPNHFTRFIFGNEYSLKLAKDSLPVTTTHLRIGYSYDQHLYLPPYLETLILDGEETTIVNNDGCSILPPTLQTLSILDTHLLLDQLTLPIGLKRLFISTVGDLIELIDGSSIPNTVTDLDLGAFLVGANTTIPSSVTKLTINFHPISKNHLAIPSSVKHLKVTFKNVNPFEPTVLMPEHFPSHSSIKHLELCSRCSIGPGSIPPSVQHLQFNGIDNAPTNIPNTVREITLSGDIYQFFKSEMSDSVTHFTITGGLFMPLVFAIPDSTTHLFLSMDQYPDLTPTDLPSSVTHLKFGKIK
ncbi:hypothetical protein DFA_03949 [Cavenderia fasciculata]|uniref:FNIP repeat-containing protein n=1 Tax=Cavenderia fasciculata TaxID=261658 RepID=F4Q0V4_CACFS|nr:uncharacterized protein DFA_03949 [Cavenderia fasciculata]EGG18455.1 hypothetical protein DFA_03949 [Cavenderia fasciculata]|eukprot:XP_004366359.1 hypothetical protein DFA_03949 [Cavenderia fasciculata]